MLQAHSSLSNLTAGTMLLLISYTTIPHRLQQCLFQSPFRKALQHVGYLRDNVTWNSLVLERQHSGTHKTEPRKSKYFLQLQNSSGITTKELQILACKSQTCPIILACFFSSPLCENLLTGPFTFFFQAENSIIFHVFKGKKKMHILICILSSFPQARMYWKLCFRQNCKPRERDPPPPFFNVL